MLFSHSTRTLLYDNNKRILASTCGVVRRWPNRTTPILSPASVLFDREEEWSSGRKATKPQILRYNVFSPDCSPTHR